MFKREHTSPVRYPKCKSVYRYYIGQIRKTKIYGHWFHRNKNFYVLENHNNILHNKKRLVWCNVKPSHYDKDVNFLIEIAIMDRQKKLKDEISKLEAWIKNVPELIREKQEKIQLINQAIKKVSKEKFDWKTYRIANQLSGSEVVRPIDLEHTFDTKTFM
jgi:hypothetical protein